MDSALVIDPQLVSDAVSSLALQTLNAYRNGVPVKWHDAELAVYLVYIFGEINKSACSFVLLTFVFNPDHFHQLVARAALLSVKLLPLSQKTKTNEKTSTTLNTP